jgi:hypothetical protein
MLLDYEVASRILNTLPSPKPSADVIFQDAMLCRVLLLEAYGVCRNHGRHRYRPVSEVKQFAENFVGHPIDNHALLIALRMNGIQPEPKFDDKSVLLVKTPPFERFEEVRDKWKQRQAAEEKDISNRWSYFQRNKK